MAFSWRSILGGRSATQSSKPALDLTNSNPVIFMLKLNPRQDRKTQMGNLIDAAKLTAAMGLPETAFAYVPDPRVSASGNYAVEASMYDRQGGTDLAHVTLDEASGLVYITLKGDTRKYVTFLEEQLREKNLGKPDILY